MKLRQITEKIKSREPIRQTGRNMADLMDYIYEKGTAQQKKALNTFLASPGPVMWEHIRWIVDDAIKTASADPQLAERVKTWAQLRNVTAPTAAASVYDIEQKELRGTPARNVGLSRRHRDKLKYALGPEGFVAATAGLSQIRSKPDVKKTLKNLSRTGDTIARAAKSDIPGVRLRRKF